MFAKEVSIFHFTLKYYCSKRCQRERTCHSRRASVSVSTKMSKLPFKIRVSLFAWAQLNRASCKENTYAVVGEARMKGNPIEWSMLLRRIIEGKREKGGKNCITSDALFSEKYTLYLNEGNTKRLFDTLPPFSLLLSFSLILKRRVE